MPRLCGCLTRADNNHDDLKLNGRNPGQKKGIVTTAPASTLVRAVTPPTVRLRASLPALRPTDPDGITTKGTNDEVRKARHRSKGKQKATNDEPKAESSALASAYAGVRSSFAGHAAQIATHGDHVAIPPAEVVIAERRRFLRRLRYPAEAPKATEETEMKDLRED